MQGFVIRGRYPSSEPTRDIYVSAALLAKTDTTWYTFDPKGAAVWDQRARAENWLLQRPMIHENYSLTIWPASILEEASA